MNIDSAVTIPMIFEKFLASKKEKTQQDSDLCDGLQQYFNQMVATQLLYRFEHPQSAIVS